KLNDLRGRVDAATILSIDGGINEQTIGQCAAAGADWFVAGSAIFNHDNYVQRVSTLTDLTE
ncbi:MAG: ribulose-phosphate 3-epimerase, partial [Planctomycetota bacterium]|nr:ribulose-phosphate 3-epimerase [Planctomycetota bacterium]